MRACFTARSASTSAPRHGKSVVRLAQLERFRVHVHDVADSSLDGRGWSTFRHIFGSIADSPPGECPAGLRLFHYKTQSREYWREVKMLRGDVHAAHNDAVRDWAFFEREDRAGSAVHDERLRDLVLSRGMAAATDCGV